MPFRYLESVGVHNAVVLAPAPATMDVVTGGRLHSSWVLQLPHPDPFLQDDVIFARSDTDVERLRARFPERDLFRLVYKREGPLMGLLFMGGPSGTADRVDAPAVGGSAEARPPRPDEAAEPTSATPDPKV
jgi:hypothetical protein